MEQSEYIDQVEEKLIQKIQSIRMWNVDKRGNTKA